ncbi:MAG TPA: cupin domain-containing protein [Dehalococcoidia bacterium]|nr:cupin domain-containing protein [Dehalococcoidia bacterium]
MTTPETGAAASRLLVQPAAEVAERQSRGELRVRQIFQAETAGFESSLSFVLWNRIPAGGANELHVHEDIEKVYYFLQGQGEVACGPWQRGVNAGDFLFFPAAIPHMVRNTGMEDLQFVVVAAKTMGTPRGLDGAPAAGD